MKKLVIKLLVIIAMFTCVFTVNAKTLNGLKIAVSLGSWDDGHGSFDFKINDTGEWISIPDSEKDQWNYGHATIEDQVINSIRVRIVPDSNSEYFYIYEIDEYGPLLNIGGQHIYLKQNQDAYDAILGEGYLIDFANYPTISDPATISLEGAAFRALTARETSVTTSISTDPDSLNPITYKNETIPSPFNFIIGGGQDFEFGADNLTWKDDTLPPNATGVSTTNSVGYTIVKNGNFIPFKFNFTDINTKIKSLIINGVEYKDETPQTDEEIVAKIADDRQSTKPTTFYIPYADTYNIQVVLTYVDTNHQGNLKWTYLPETSLEGDDKLDSINRGTLSYVSGKYEDTTYTTIDDWKAAGDLFDWKDGNKNYGEDTSASWGEASFAKGSELTINLLPDPGYQLTSLFDNKFELGTNIGDYTLSLPSGKTYHLEATFDQTDNEVKNNHTALASGSIGFDGELSSIIDNGTIRLNIKEVTNPSEAFETKATEEEVEIKEYLDLSLENIIHKAKATSDDAWVTTKDLSTLSDNANVSLVLNESLGNSVVVLHEKTDGSIEIIDSTYDEETKTVSFATKSFSTYALGTPIDQGKDIFVREYDCDGEVVKEGWIHINPGESYKNLPYEAIEDETTYMFGPTEEECYIPEKHDQDILNDDEKYGTEFYDYDANYVLEIVEVLDLTPEELEELDVTPEEYEQAVNTINELIKDEKDVLDVFISNLYDEDKRGTPVPGEDDEYYDGLMWPDEIKFKAKLVDGYDSYKLICLDEGLDGGEVEVYEGTIKDGYVYFDVDYANGLFALVGDYKYICAKGHNQTWTKDSTTGLDFTFKRSAKDEVTFDSFDYADIDGKKVDVNASKGSVIANVAADELNKLSVGNHVITAHFNDGKTASASFVINENKKDNEKKDEDKKDEDKKDDEKKSEDKKDDSNKKQNHRIVVNTSVK